MSDTQSVELLLLQEELADVCGTLGSLYAVEQPERPQELLTLDRKAEAEKDFDLLQNVRALTEDHDRVSETFGCINGFARTRRDIQRCKASHSQLILGGMKTMLARKAAMERTLEDARRMNA